MAAIVLFYTPSGKTTKAIFEDYAGEITHEKYKELIAWLKERKFSRLVFSLRYPYGIEAVAAPERDDLQHPKEFRREEKPLLFTRAHFILEITT